MLFDLQSGKRRRVVQVVFGTMALLFGVSFLFFGIGSDAQGGLADLLGFGTNDPGTSNPQFEEQIDQAEERLAADPEDEKALLDLAEIHYQAAQFELQQDPESEDAQAEFGASLDAWERYLKLDPKKPDPGVAAFASQAYVQLADAKGAAEAQRIVAEDNPSSGTYANLAYYLYVAGKIDEGDEAARIAVAEADDTQREQIEKQLAQLSEQATKLLERAEKQAKQAGEEGTPTGAPAEDPFGSLGGLGGAAPPVPGAPPPAP